MDNSFILFISFTDEYEYNYNGDDQYYGDWSVERTKINNGHSQAHDDDEEDTGALLLLLL